MQDKDINERIRQLCDTRGWTIYRLAKESEITYSTLCTMLHKSNVPSIPTLLKICNGLGISPSEFFDSDHECILLSPDEKNMISTWKELTDENKNATSKYIHYLLNEQYNNK